MRVLVTGANGYIGGRLVPRLLSAGHDVRVMVRSVDRIAGFPWQDHVDVHVGDVREPASLEGCCDGVDAAYYLVHGMSHSKDFRRADLDAARNFGEAAGSVAHIIYLGGLQPEGQASAHLASRAEVGAELARHGPITELRAGPIIGSGSASFEMTRYLTERLPIMVTPRWVDNAIQPIAIRDVLAYLLATLEAGPQGVVDIGGDEITFRGMMRGYADARGLRRIIKKVPVLAPTLAARWVQFITPIPNSLAIPLLGGIVHPVRANTTSAQELFPDIHPLTYADAVRLAIDRQRLDEVETRWTDSHGVPGYQLTDWENMKREVRSVHINATPEDVFALVASLGGDNGWLAWNWAWKVRGALDRLVGGPGLRRGRRSPTKLRAGDAVDFWRVEAVEAPELVRLRAEMKVPGKAWLQFEVKPEDGGTRLIQTAFFEPRGLSGVAYWNSLYPIHRLIFSKMASNARKRFA